MSNSTRERLIATAGELFHRQGFHATGMNQILAQSGQRLRQWRHDHADRIEVFAAHDPEALERYTTLAR